MALSRSGGPLCFGEAKALGGPGWAERRAGGQRCCGRLGEVPASTASPPSWQLRLGWGRGLFPEPGREAGRDLGLGRWPRASPPQWAALLCGPEEALQRPGPFVCGEDGASVAWLLQAWKESGIEKTEPASRMGRRSQYGSLLDLSHRERLTGRPGPGDHTLPSSAGLRVCAVCRCLWMFGGSGPGIISLQMGFEQRQEGSTTLSVSLSADSAGRPRFPVLCLPPIP